MSFGNRGGGFGGPREMHNATCAECNQTTQVPFRPTEGRPVYCRDCFAKRSPDRGDRGGDRGGRGGSFGGDREMHEATCAECNQPTQVPFKPTEGRPVYCRDCFAKRAPPRGGSFGRR